MSRSVNTEVTLEPGRYSVLVKVTARRCGWKAPPEEVIKKNALNRREKLTQIGLLYDLAHAKAAVTETEEEKNAREERENRKKKAEREKLRQKAIKKKRKDWIKMKKEAARQRRINAAMQPEADVATQVSDLAQSGSTGEEDGDSEDSPGTEKSESRDEEEDIPSTVPEDKNQNLLEGFEFDSDLDMPSEDDDDSVYVPSLDGDEDGDEDDEDDEATPWNAVCVIGLKVYSKDPQLSLQVVKPAEEDLEVTLDLDHPAASAAQEKGSP